MTNHSAQNPLDAHARKSIVLYIPTNGAGKNIITKSFNILDSDPVRSRVEGSPAFSRYPGRANFPYISLENSSKLHLWRPFFFFVSSYLDPSRRTFSARGEGGGCVRTHRTPPCLRAWTRSNTIDVRSPSTGASIFTTFLSQPFPE